MKRLLAILCLLVLIVSIPIACKKSSGDSAPVPPPGDIVVPPGPGPNPATVPINFTTPQQAAGSTAAIDGMQATSSAQFAAIMALGVDSRPPGFAPALSRSTGAISKVDPTLAMMVSEMQRLAASPTVQKAVQKVRALKAASLATPVDTTMTLEFCSNADGQVKIAGLNNFDEVGNPTLTSDYTIDFTNCKDDIFLTRLGGTLHIEDASSTDNAGVKTSLLATNLTMEQFTTVAYDVMAKKSVLNGPFIRNDQVNFIDDEASGSFVVTTPAGALPEKVVTYAYTGLHVETTHTDNPNGTDSIAATTKGTFKLTTTTGGVKTFDLNFAMDLAEQRIQLNDAAGTETSQLSGAIDITYASELEALGCQTGKVVITTTTPREFTTAGGACPHKGTVNLNNATINYDPGQPIRVTIGGGTPQSFADCAALDAAGGSCKF